MLATDSRSGGGGFAITDGDGIFYASTDWKVV
jgi:hypothetical protein